MDWDIYGLNWQASFSDATFANNGAGVFRDTTPVPSSGGDANEVDYLDYDADDPTFSGAGDGVDGNDGLSGGGPNDGLDYPVISVAESAGSAVHVEGNVPTGGAQTVDIYLARDDGDNDGEVVLVPRMRSVD